MRVSEMFEQLINVMPLAESTVKDYRWQAKFIRQRPELEVFPEDKMGQMEYFTNFVKLLPDDYANSTVKKRLKKFHAIQKYLDMIYLRVKPVSFVQGNAEKQHQLFLTEEEVKVIHNYPGDGLTVKQKRLKDMFVFVCYTGLRLSEMMSLSLGNIEGGMVKYMSFVAKKNQRERKVPIPVIALEILQKYLAVSEEGKPLMQLSMGYTSNGLKVITKKIALETGGSLNDPTKVIKAHGRDFEEIRVPKYDLMSLHVGRHTYGALLLSWNVSMVTVSALLGHAHVATTEKYYKHIYDGKVMEDVFGLINKNTL